MATPQRVEALRAANRSYPKPVTVRALVDTGAACSVVDAHVLKGLGLAPTGSVQVHTPSTDGTYQYRDQYDVSLALSLPRESGKSTRMWTVGVIASELAREGFFALIGWDLLKDCVLHCNGPKGEFSLKWTAPVS